MNILAIGCIHNDVENLMTYSDKIALLDFDVIVCPGDFADLPPKGFTVVDIGKLVVEELKMFKKPVLAVPGSWDKDLIGFLEKEKISLHGKGVVVEGVGFYGFGGAKTPFGLPFEPSEDEIKFGLECGFEKIKNCGVKVQVTHAPPAGTRLDLISSGAHVGSEAVRGFIEEHSPQVAICSHIHEGRGVDSIGATKIINTGRYPEGHCGFVTIDKNNVTAKLINLI